MTDFYGDFSNHDWNRGSMDFTAMARDGLKGAFHKCLDGLYYYKDPYWTTAIPRIKTAFAGGIYGPYHVIWGNRSITDQIDWLLGYIDQTTAGWRTDPNYQLMTDNEPFSYNTAPTIDQVNQAGDYILNKTGKVMLAYCPPWYYGSNLSRLRYPLVSSNYGSNPAVHYPDAYPGDASPRWVSAIRATCLQFGSNTKIGYQSTCDCNGVLSLANLKAVLNGGKVGTADNFAVSFSQGQLTFNTVDGKTLSNEPVKWRLADEQWQSKVDTVIVDILAQIKSLADQVAAIPAQPPVNVTVDAAAVAAALVADPTLLAKVHEAAESGNLDALALVLKGAAATADTQATIN